MYRNSLFIYLCTSEFLKINSFFMYKNNLSMYRNGSCVECGLCDKTVHVPEDKKTKARINFFKKLHYNK